MKKKIHLAFDFSWTTRVMVGETETEAQALRESLIADVPMKAVGSGAPAK
jgi:hypothetical protein